MVGIGADVDSSVLLIIFIIGSLGFRYTLCGLLVVVVNFLVGLGLEGFSHPEGRGLVMKDGSVVACQCMVFRLLGLDMNWAENYLIVFIAIATYVSIDII